MSDTNKDLIIDLAGSLVAAISVMETAQGKGKRPSHAFGSDKMFNTAMEDYKKSLERARDYLRQED